MTVYWLCSAGMLVSGIGWGLTEASINPLTAQLYPEDTTHRLNVLHAWLPGGIIIGGLAGFFLSATLPWQGILALVMIPALAAVVVAAITTFPPPLRSETGVSFGQMVSEVFRRPSFFIWFGAMFLTAASELAPGQWIDVALSNRVGMRGILLLVYVSALMFVFRHFAGRLANRISNPGLLWVSSLLAAIGLFMLSQAAVAGDGDRRRDRLGAGRVRDVADDARLGRRTLSARRIWAMGLVGSAGALASFFVLPQLARCSTRAKVEFAGGPEAFAALTGDAKLAVEDAAASVSFERLAILPLILLVVFGFIWLRERGKSRAALAGEKPHERDPPHGAAGGAAAAAAAGPAWVAPPAAQNAARFSLGFAPHEGSFTSRGDRLEQIAYAADQGFTAWEDNEAAGRTVAEQTAMAQALRQRGMTMGVFVAGMPKWAEFRPLLGGNDNADREALPRRYPRLDRCRQAAQCEVDDGRSRLPRPQGAGRDPDRPHHRYDAPRRRDRRAARPGDGDGAAEHDREPPGRLPADHRAGICRREGRRTARR